MSDKALFLIMPLQLAILIVFRMVMLFNSDPFCCNHPKFLSYSNVIFFRKIPNRSTAAITISQLGLMLLLVAKFICSDFPTDVVIRKIVSLLKKFKGTDDSYIQAIAIDISSIGSNKRSHFKVLVG